MTTCNLKYYYPSGVGSIENVKGTSKKLQDYYRKALNNKKNRTITFEGTNGVDTIVNLDNVAVLEIRQNSPSEYDTGRDK